MKKNEILPLCTEKLGAELEGICRADGLPVFVPGLLPGESADVQILKTEKRFAFGKAVSIPFPTSPYRKNPECSAYPQCGGCTGRHMRYELTLEAKRQQVQDCLQRIGNLSVDVPPVIGMDNPCEYRNKTSLPVGGSDESPFLGFYAPRSHRIIPIERCPNAMRPSDEISRAVVDWMRRFHLSPYQEETGRGLIRHLQIRINQKHESMVTLVVNGSHVPGTNALAEALRPLGVVSLWINENRRNTNVILGSAFHHIYGSKTLTDTLCGLRFDLSPASFFQVNPIQTEKLYALARSFAQPKATDTLCDVYCGAGTIGLSMAAHCKKIIGIEIVPAAVQNAKENAIRNGIQNAEFLEGKAENLLPELIGKGLKPDVILVDPPRKGLESAVIQAIAQAGPDRLVYVSCNPATLARDAGLLKEFGYMIQKIQPVDMFCWTSGIETVVCLSNKNTRTKDYVEIGLDVEDYYRIKDSAGADKCGGAEEDE